MERTVPRSASDEIDLYLRTIYSLLRSSSEIQIRSLEEVHAGMNSSLHIDVRRSTPDTSAFIYAILRLPFCISDVKTVVLGQSAPVFEHAGYADVEKWQPVFARARRRRCYYDKDKTLACFIASRSDIEDVIPVLTAYQIEWNKLHDLLQKVPAHLLTNAAERTHSGYQKLADHLGIPPEDLDRLYTIWGNQFTEMLKKISSRRSELSLRLLSGSLSEYWRATRIWWDNIEQSQPLLLSRPVYFISSNTHSIANLLSGFALHSQDDLLHFLDRPENGSLLLEWQEIRTRQTQSNAENFLYYMLKKVEQSNEGKELLKEQEKIEKAHGVVRVPSGHSFDLEAQVIELSSINPADMDQRLLINGAASNAQESYEFLKRSNALILNIDYPLGLGAYNILAKLAEHISEILGVYIMGKAATLNGIRGDVMIPSVVQDEQSQNTYLFQNAFIADDVRPYLVYGTVLDNQKALTVLGTFLQNSRLMDVMYREGYTDIEMEAGPYLSAVYEMFRPKRHPVNEIVNLYGTPFDVGILHYASDTPLSKGKNLGAGALSYEGMDSTYASSVAILRRIFQLEKKRVEKLQG